MFDYDERALSERVEEKKPLSTLHTATGKKSKPTRQARLHAPQLLQEQYLETCSALHEATSSHTTSYPCLDMQQKYAHSLPYWA